MPSFESVLRYGFPETTQDVNLKQEELPWTLIGEFVVRPVPRQRNGIRFPVMEPRFLRLLGMQETALMEAIAVASPRWQRTRAAKIVAQFLKNHDLRIKARQSEEFYYRLTNYKVNENGQTYPVLRMRRTFSEGRELLVVWTTSRPGQSGRTQGVSVVMGLGFYLDTNTGLLESPFAFLKTTDDTIERELGLPKANLLAREWFGYGYGDRFLTKAQNMTAQNNYGYAHEPPGEDSQVHRLNHPAPNPEI